MKNRERRTEAGTPVPSFTAELGTRFSLVIERIGGLKKAAETAGTSDETLANWRDGRARPSLFGVIGLAEAADVSVEWLATGREPMERGETADPAQAQGHLVVDPALFNQVVDWTLSTMIEEGIPIRPDKIGDFFLAVYELAVQDQEHDNIVDLDKYRRMLRATG